MNLKKIIIFITLIVTMGVSKSAFSQSDSERGELLMGVAPIMSPDKLFKRLTPLRNYLSEKLDREVVVELTRNVDQLLERTDADRYDFVFTGPSFILRALDSGLYVTGALPGALTTAVLLVSHSSDITTIEQLKGKIIATPPAKGVAAKVAQNFFKESGFNKQEFPIFTPYASHNAAFMAALNGDVDAAFIASFSYRDAIKSGASVREIAKSKPFPGIGFVFSKRLSEQLREDVISLIVDLDKSAHGKMVLKKISFPPFRRFSYTEYDNARGYFGLKSRADKVSKP